MARTVQLLLPCSILMKEELIARVSYVGEYGKELNELRQQQQQQQLSQQYEYEEAGSWQPRTTVELLSFEL